MRSFWKIPGRVHEDILGEISGQIIGGIPARTSSGLPGEFLEVISQLEFLHKSIRHFKKNIWKKCLGIIPKIPDEAFF